MCQKSDMHTHRLVLALATLTSLIAACAAPAGEETSTSSESNLTQDDPFLQVNDGNGDDIVLAFVSGNRPSQNGGAMSTHSNVSVTYDTSRLSRCGTLANGTPSAAKLELGYRVAGGPATMIPLGTDWVGGVGSQTARAALPKLGASAFGPIELWFHATGPAGCEAYDSNFGHNYPFLIHRADVGDIAFGADIAVVPTPGTLPSGGLVRVTYDAERLSACASGGTETVEMSYRFDGGAWHEKVHDVARDGSMFTPIGVPFGAHAVEFWFQATDRPRACFAYDSRFTANYHFTLAP